MTTLAIPFSFENSLCVDAVPGFHQIARVARNLAGVDWHAEA